MVSLKAKRIQTDDDFVTLGIRKKDLESFCAAAGLYRREFLVALAGSAADHSNSRVTRRESLAELLPK